MYHGFFFKLKQNKKEVIRLIFAKTFQNFRVYLISDCVELTLS